jgi:hypothetical protein
MKKLLIIATCLFMMASCRPDKDDETVPNGGPGNTNGHVTAEAAGKWLHGSFAMASFWGYDGSYQGNPFSQSVAFDFKTDGSYEMFYTGQTNDFGCTRDAFSYYKGYVVFTDSTFTVHPQSGKFRGYYKCSPSQNFDRPAAASELKVQTYYYNYETDTNNKKWMVVKFTPTDQFPSYFAATSW